MQPTGAQPNTGNHAHDHDHAHEASGRDHDREPARGRDEDASAAPGTGPVRSNAAAGNAIFSQQMIKSDVILDVSASTAEDREVVGTAMDGLREFEAATVIQSAFRGWLARSEDEVSREAGTGPARSNAAGGGEPPAEPLFERRPLPFMISETIPEADANANVSASCCTLRPRTTPAPEKNRYFG